MGAMRIGAASRDFGGRVGCKCGNEQNKTETSKFFGSVPKNKGFIGYCAY